MTDKPNDPQARLSPEAEKRILLAIGKGKRRLSEARIGVPPEETLASPEHRKLQIECARQTLNAVEAEYTATFPMRHRDSRWSLSMTLWGEWLADKMGLDSEQQHVLFLDYQIAKLEAAMTETAPNGADQKNETPAVNDIAGTAAPNGAQPAHKRELGAETPIGARLKVAREAVGQTQLQVAEAVGVEESTIARIEQGRRKNMRPGTRARIENYIKSPPKTQ